MPMYSTRYTVYRHRPPSGWAIFWLVMLVLFFIGLLIKLWPAVLACFVAWGTYKLLARRRAAQLAERQRLLYNAYLPHPDAWLTPDEWQQRHHG